MVGASLATAVSGALQREVARLSAEGVRKDLMISELEGKLQLYDGSSLEPPADKSKDASMQCNISPQRHCAEVQTEYVSVRQASTGTQLPAAGSGHPGASLRSKCPAESTIRNVCTALQNLASTGGVDGHEPLKAAEGLHAIPHPNSIYTSVQRSVSEPLKPISPETYAGPFATPPPQTAMNA